MVINVKRYVWSKKNLRHLAKHNVSVEEVVELFSKYHYVEKTKQKRLLAIGETDEGRILEIPFARKGEGRIFAITAYDARSRKAHHYLGAKNKKEVSKYQNKEK